MTIKSTDTLNLDEAWIYKVSVLADRIRFHVTQAVSRVSELNLSQWRVLAAIADEPGRSARDVVAITPMDKAIVSRATAKLIAHGLLRKSASKADGRVSHLYLTAQGSQIYGTIIAEMARVGADGQMAMSASEAEAFLDQIDRLIANYPKKK